ncbi:hypothetical protein [Lentzea flaviverrucosa]|uniref:Uncharacterized protein n=1 Tax=Lentzea flaviverrucosa TaxID=200379 RepID=A0A1H9MAZ0_9PSEU|nr:hypothetical protein [Lentzea flaviverrucosa]RDI30994.1 hypothetical protein DFR72_104328 [Lentzea flaviverrucosa]SER20856.1 hypothetical protein SAMN05216195_104299 [Lentzea flaviverrucosa]
MSSIVKFFAATNEEAAAHGPDPSSRPLSCGNFDAEEALLHWEEHLTGTSFDDLLDSDVPEVVAEHEDTGAWVFALSDALQRSLANASTAALDELARRWAESSTGRIDPAIAADLLRNLADLIRNRPPGTRVHCWTS